MYMFIDLIMRVNFVFYFLFAKVSQKYDYVKINVKLSF